MCTGKAGVNWHWSRWARLCEVALILAACGVAQASVIPSPELPYGNDSVRTPDGFQCSSAVSPSSYIDAGVYQEDDGKYDDSDRGAYVRVLVPLYSGVKRLDCSELYLQALKEREREKSLSNVKSRVFGD
ncbi:hypothetical protein NVP1205O_46 [Vibrio phage 1.205.O._10N.222.51.A7]|nr:hypothetical protein NVP1205O_46 [Vibrio phage 1.205.O._10N.222.51.A7]